MRILKASLLYFGIVFVSGFVLRPIRIWWVVPHFGQRMAELMEAPIMLVVIILTARWIVRRLALPPAMSSRLGMGCIALGLMLVAEFAFVLWLRGLSISEYLASPDVMGSRIVSILLNLFETGTYETRTVIVYAIPRAFFLTYCFLYCYIRLVLE